MKLTFVLNRLAFALIAVLVLLALLSAIIPQTDFAEERVVDWHELLGENYVVIEALGLDRIYYTPFFFVVLALLGITLIVGTLQRFRLVYKIERTLLRARHIGSIIFHFSLLVIMLGTILNYLHKSDGVLALTEGQTAIDAEGSYHRAFSGPLHEPRSDRFRLRLEQFHPEYPVESTPTEAAEISLWAPSQADPLTATVRTNQPLKWANLEFHYGLRSGYSPEIQVTDSSGQDVFRGFVRTATQRMGDSTIYADFIILSEQSLRIEVEVQPGTADGESASYRATVLKDSLEVYHGRLSTGDTARFAGLHLTIPRLRRWCYIDVVESPYLSLVFFGFWSALAGMTIGFIPRVMRPGEGRA